MQWLRPLLSTTRRTTQRCSRLRWVAALLPYVCYRDRPASTLTHISTTNNKVHNQALFTTSMGSYTTMPSFIRDKPTTNTAIHLSDYNDITRHTTLTSCICWILGYIAFLRDTILTRTVYYSMAGVSQLSTFSLTITCRPG